MKEEKWLTWKDVVWFVCMIGFLFLARYYIFTPIIVNGASMDPTLEDQERLIGLKFGEIKRFEIVTFNAPDEKEDDYIKRVIGLPGDTVQYKEDVLYINGQATDEPYLAEFKAKIGSGEVLTDDFSATVPANTYFVMGDNRQNSKDSRRLGAIAEDEIIARAKFSFWPLNTVGTLE